MRKWKMALAGVLSLFMVEAPAVCSMPVYSVAAAETTVQDTDVLKGLVKENGKYYYYVDGKMQKGWQNVTTTKSNGQSVTYRYYFGANGAAYAGTKVYGTSVPAVKKISGAYYGFDRLGHMLKGTYVANNKFYVFSSKNGKMNGTLSVKLRSACKYKKSTATLKRLLKNIGLKPLKTQKLEGCYGDGYDVIYTYKNFQISAHENLDGTEIFLGLIAR